MDRIRFDDRLIGLAKKADEIAPTGCITTIAIHKTNGRMVPELSVSFFEQSGETTGYKELADRERDGVRVVETYFYKGGAKS